VVLSVRKGESSILILTHKNTVAAPLKKKNTRTTRSERRKGGRLYFFGKQRAMLLVKRGVGSVPSRKREGRRKAADEAGKGGENVAS